MNDLYAGLRERPSGGRLYERPGEVKACGTCGAPAGRNYAGCRDCYQAVEAIWLMDWEALIGNENIKPGSEDEILLARLVFEEQDRHPWTVVDTAMTMIECNTCGAEIGGGELGCPECDFAFESLWGYDAEAMHQGKMTGNEHALRVGRWVLRYPHRQKNNIVESWKISMPILLTGKLPTNKQAAFLKRIIDENKYDLSSRVFQSFDEAYAYVVNSK